MVVICHVQEIFVFFSLQGDSTKYFLDNMERIGQLVSNSLLNNSFPGRIVPFVNIHLLCD